MEMSSITGSSEGAEEPTCTGNYSTAYVRRYGRWRDSGKSDDDTSSVSAVREAAHGAGS